MVETVGAGIARPGVFTTPWGSRGVEDAAPYGWRQTRLPPCKANDEPNHHA